MAAMLRRDFDAAHADPPLAGSLPAVGLISVVVAFARHRRRVTLTTSGDGGSRLVEAVTSCGKLGA